MSHQDTRKYVVYVKPFNRTKAGVYHRRVTIDGNIAFIHPKEDGMRADVVPATSVFNDEKSAMAYFAGNGLKRWIVDPGSSRDGRPCELFEGFVHYGAYSRRQFGKIVKRCDGKDISKDAWVNSFQTFETKKEALKFFRERRNEQKKNALETLEAARRLITALTKISKASR